MDNGQQACTPNSDISQQAVTSSSVAIGTFKVAHIAGNWTRIANEFVRQFRETYPSAPLLDLTMPESTPERVDIDRLIQMGKLAKIAGCKAAAIACNRLFVPGCKARFEQETGVELLEMVQQVKKQIIKDAQGNPTRIGVVGTLHAMNSGMYSFDLENAGQGSQIQVVLPNQKQQEFCQKLVGQNIDVQGNYVSRDLVGLLKTFAEEEKLDGIVLGCTLYVTLLQEHIHDKYHTDSGPVPGVQNITALSVGPASEPRSVRLYDSVAGLVEACGEYLLRSEPCESFFKQIAPMGIYETIYSFEAAFGRSLGSEGTFPWTHGVPSPLPFPGGPELPKSVSFDPVDLKYGKISGMDSLRQKICSYYRDNYGASISADNVMVFAGVRPGLFAILLQMQKDVHVRIASTEYPPYWNMLEQLAIPYSLVHSGEDNLFRPQNEEYFTAAGKDKIFAVMSNPTNPTGFTRSGKQLEDLINRASHAKRGLLIDEAYELIHQNPESALKYVKNIDDTNIFVCGGTTKAFQIPGIRVGWVVASQKHIKSLNNFGTFAMGNVSHAAQKVALQILDEKKNQQLRTAIPQHYFSVRDRYAEGMKALGFKLFTGEGGFSHWVKLPGEMTTAELNRCLFKRGGAVLAGEYTDMLRRGQDSPLKQFFRFCYGFSDPKKFEADLDIFKSAYAEALEISGEAPNKKRKIDTAVHT